MHAWNDQNSCGKNVIHLFHLQTILLFLDPGKEKLGIKSSGHVWFGVYRILEKAWYILLLILIFFLKLNITDAPACKAFAINDKSDIYIPFFYNTQGGPQNRWYQTPRWWNFSYLLSGQITRWLQVSGKKKHQNSIKFLYTRLLYILTTAFSFSQFWSLWNRPAPFLSNTCIWRSRWRQT